jgi:hypothetical protein
MVTGLTNVLNDTNYVPRDGSVEICVVQFSDTAVEELPPTVVTDATIAGIKATILAIVPQQQWTAMGAGIFQTLATMQKSSANFDNPNVWKVINLATDGLPNVSPGHTTPDYPNGKLYAESAVTAAVAAGIDELDVEGIGTGVDEDWMALSIAYPDGVGGNSGPIVPPALYPPRPPNPNFMGFVRVCTTFADYENAVQQKLTLILKGFLSLTPLEATNNINTQHCVIATLIDGNLAPISGKTINFAVTGVNPTSGSAVTATNGQAQFCYTGTSIGTDTIVATWDGTSVGMGLLTSGPATKDWKTGEPPTTPPTTEVGGEISSVSKTMLIVPVVILAVVILAVIGIIIRRRVTQR